MLLSCKLWIGKEGQTREEKDTISQANGFVEIVKELPTMVEETILDKILQRIEIVEKQLATILEAIPN